MSFRVRIAIVVFGLTALTMGAAFGIVWERFVASQRAQLDEALLDVARQEASDALGGQLEFTDAPGPSANAVGPLPKYGVLYGVNGVPLSTTNNFASIPPMPRLAPYDAGMDIEHDGVPMRAVVVAVGSTGRRILLATPRHDLEEDARILGRAMAIAFAVGCAWAAAVAFGVASWLTREHRTLGVVARRVAEGDTSARVSFRSRDADLRQLADDLNVMIDQLVGLVAAQDRFIAHAAHELRTPLTSLRIELEHVLRTGRGRADYEEAVRGALESSRALTELADDLLQLARAKTAPVEEASLVEEALTDAIAAVAPMGRGRDVRILASPFGGQVRGARRSLARLFRNLLENAVRFSPQGGRVLVEGRVEENRVVVEVTDAGPGVPTGDEERIFAPFARGVRDDAEGVGLGLAIARGLARSAAGDVIARAGPGGRFEVELTRSPLEAGPPETDGARPYTGAAPYRIEATLRGPR